MFKPPILSPSLLSADQCNIAAEVASATAAGASWLHVDVMDGHFVPNQTLGVPLVKSLKSCTNAPLDVHLMIDNPLCQIPWFLDAGSDIITFHAEACETQGQMLQAIQIIREGGAKAGVAIKPATPVDAIKYVVPHADMVLVMSVEPGFSGQKFMPCAIEKIADVVQLARAQGKDPYIQVDGGINPQTASQVIAQGADVLVAGNAFFKAPDRTAAAHQILNA